MNRQQRRASERKTIKMKTKTYNLTEEQLRNYIEQRVREELLRQKSKIKNDAVSDAVLLLFTLPMEVLMDHYWKKSYEKRIPEFTSYLLDYYQRWQDGEFTMEQLKQDLWEYGRVRLEVKE